jgi:hypothetical protein
MSQNGTRFRWSKGKRKAAQLLAEDTLTEEEIAQELKISRRTLCRWKQHPEFAAQVRALVAQYGALAERFSIGRVARRLEVLDENWRAMQRLKAERGKAPNMQDVPGGSTGLLVHDVKTVGSGEHARQVDIYRFDAALVKQMRETAREAAEELGQRTGGAAEKDPSDRPYYKVYLFDPHNLTPEDPDDEPRRLPPVPALEPPPGEPPAAG